MTVITKTAENGITVKVDSAGKKYRGKFITLLKDGKEVASGNEFYRDAKFIKLPEGAVSALRDCDTYQALGPITTDAIIECLDEYNDHPEIRLPRERQALVSAIGGAWDNWSHQRERDFDNDIGFHNSPKAEKSAKDAEQALKDFDKANPELAAKIAKEKAKETERSIQSALNA
jgi:hypothetical protein